jgi:hypothetical protein
MEQRDAREGGLGEWAGSRRDYRMTIVDFGFLIGKRKKALLGQFKNQQSEIINHQSNWGQRSEVRGQRSEVRGQRSGVREFGGTVPPDGAPD